MEKFVIIAQRHGITRDNYLPLWNIVEQMDDKDIHELVNYIDDCIDYCSEVRKYAQEVCLMYAYWWQKKYKGGAHKYESALTDLKFKHKDTKIFSDAVSYELEDRKCLGIPICRTLNTKRWLDSVFAQGGLPLSWLSNGDNRSQLVGFLDRIVQHYDNIADPAWNDCSYIMELAKEWNMPSFAQSEAFCYYCLLVVESISTGHDTHYASSIIRNIIARVKEFSSKRKISSFFVDWHLQKVGETLSYCFSLRAPKMINLGEGSFVVSRRYYINGEFIAEYLNQGGVLYLQSERYLPKFKPLINGCEALFLECSDDNGPLSSSEDNSSELSLYNATKPVIEDPIALRYEYDGMWTIDSGYKDDYAFVLYQDQWHTVIELNPVSYSLEGVCFFMSKVVWTETPSIEFFFGSRIITISANTIEYNISHNFRQFDWIESANRLIVIRNDNLLRTIRVKNNEGRSIQPRDWKVQYKINDSYYDLTATSRLPLGAIMLRVCLPQGRYKYLRIFSIERDYYNRVSENVFCFNCEGVDVHLIPGQPVTNFSNGSYRTNERVMYVRFMLSKGSSEMEVSVIAPAPNSSFWNTETNQRLANNSSISIRDLNRYKVYQNGGQKMRISFYRSKEGASLANAIVDWRGNEYHTLSYASGIIEKFLSIYPMTRAAALQLSIGGISINVVNEICEFELHRTAETVTLKAQIDGVYQEGLAISAIPLNQIFNDSFSEIHLEETTPGCYSLPVELSPAVVFSESRLKSFFPELIDVEEIELPLELHIERRRKRRTESIAKVRGILNNENHIGWGHLWTLFDIVIKYHLPYNTFDTFLALKDNPDHLAYFITHLRESSYAPRCLTDEPSIDFLLELERMEQELDFGFHYLPQRSWSIAMSTIGEEYNKYANVQRVIGVNPMSEADYRGHRLLCYKRLLERQFGLESLPNTHLHVYDVISMKQEFGETMDYMEIIRDDIPNYDEIYNYAEKIVNAYIPNCNEIGITIPEDMPQNFSLSPNIDYGEIDNIVAKMQYFSIILPQVAAKVSRDEIEKFWHHSLKWQDLRRMINYVRKFAPAVYNPIFLKSYY